VAYGKKSEKKGDVKEKGTGVFFLTAVRLYVNLITCLDAPDPLSVVTSTIFSTEPMPGPQSSRNTPITKPSSVFCPKPMNGFPCESSPRNLRGRESFLE
jgi:hypothetical protein